MESLQVKDYVNRRPVTFNAEMPVAEAVESLIQSHQSGGPVLDEAGRLVGFLSEKDCIRKMVESSYYREQVARVKDIMHDKVEVVKSYDSVLEVAQKMVAEVPKVYPVLDGEGDLIGTISRADILYAIDVQLRDSYKK